jgi:hypothetical protein
MHSGIKYSGSISGVHWSSQQQAEQLARLGLFLIMETATGKFRLDGLDIKAWKATSQPSPVPIAGVIPA